MVYLDSLLALDGNTIKTDPKRDKSVHWGYTFVDHSIIKVKNLMIKNIIKLRII